MLLRSGWGGDNSERRTWGVVGETTPHASKWGRDATCPMEDGGGPPLLTAQRRHHLCQALSLPAKVSSKDDKQRSSACKLKEANAGYCGGQELDAYLWGHLAKERDVHFLTLGHQASEEWLVRPFGVIDGWLVALRGKEKGVIPARVRDPTSLAHSPPSHILTKSLRCRAQTRPSPPLFPGPQMTRTVGGLLDIDVGGYA